MTYARRTERTLFASVETSAVDTAEVRTRAKLQGTGLTWSSVAVAVISLKRSAEGSTSSEEGVSCLFPATTVTSPFFGARIR